MPPPVKSLADALNEILDAAADALTAQVGDGLTLEGIKTVVRTDRTRPLPETPALWVIPGVARQRNTDQQYALHEQWSTPLDVVAMVDSDEPEVGHQESSDFAAKSQDVLIAQRSAGTGSSTLGLDYVRNIESVEFDPQHELETDRLDLYWARARVEVTFVILRN